ncbi:uncharacterized protein B0P05DRAFT_563384 [Gilbertella persicaria]|uniref:uncharacterized protein n=1 Tax=Gilbertella persicaria TaxID=101096 RepID=UPI00221EAB51|nr:uncharacterized protein B0P05DRAFT_563384 [Gilbertella persicaria]KAI8049790.1 hypothetical protein B0P05DRAFT_563384 [Gilbertella persicaria]
MSSSVADIYDDYLESLQNLPSEIDQNMHELRRMDDDLYKFKEGYSKNRRAYTKICRNSPANTSALVTTRLQIEKDYKTAMQKQDQKIELAMRMYDLVSRHIERLDFQVAKSGIHESDWIHQRTRKGPHLLPGNRKRAMPVDGMPSTRKRIHHSNRPNPSSMSHHEFDIDSNEPTYCYCKQVSFGDMIACDGENCEREWFHYACVGLVQPPAGKWFCEECKLEEAYNSFTDEDGDDDSS